VDNNLPEFNSWLRFIGGDIIVGLDLDALRNSHPIEVCLHTFDYNMFNF